MFCLLFLSIVQIGTPELPSNTKDDSTTKHASAFPFPNEFTLLMLPLQMRSIPPFLIHTRLDSGYTVASCGRVGRGRNVRFPTFQLDHYGPTDGPMDGPTDGRTKPLIELRVRN